MISSNLLSVIMVGQYLIFPKMASLLDILFRMKKDQESEIVTFSSKIDEAIYPIVKNDVYGVGRYITRTNTRRST